MKPSIATSDAAVQCVRDYLLAMQERRLDEAERFLAPGVEIVFPGGHHHADVHAIVAASRGRYRRIAKRLSPFEVYPAPAGRWLVLSTGTLEGEWPDGGEFAGVRFIDRFEIGPQGIQVQQVWNDLGEARSAGRET